MLDVIVLSYNGIETTKDFLKFYRKNTIEGVNLIWIDNGSTDGTIEFLEANLSSSDILIKSETNLGIIKGRNLGYSISKAKYVIYLDNDQFIMKDFFQNHISFLEDNKLDLVGVEAWQMNNEFMPIRKVSKIDKTYSYIGAGGMLMKREVPEKIGMFDERYLISYFEDPDYCFMANKNGFKIGWNKDAKLIHMEHSTLKNNPDRAKRFNDNYMRFKEKWNEHNLPEFKI